MVTSGLQGGDIDALLDAVASKIEQIEPVRVSFIWRPMLLDPNDEMVLEAAIKGQADLVVTMNLRHLSSGLKRFGISAMKPGPAAAAMLRRPKE